MPKGVYERALKSYPADVVAQVRSHYVDQEMTLIEVAAALGMGDEKVRNIMRRSGIPARPPVMRRPLCGADNPRWKGEDASYRSMHSRLDRANGKPKECSACGTTDPEVTYDWANLTGNYNDMGDYARMCRFCHRKYDAARRRTS